MSGTGKGRAGARPLRTDDIRPDGMRADCRLLVRARRARRAGAGATAKDQGGAFSVFIADGLPRYHADSRIFPRRRGRAVPGINGLECHLRSGTAGRRVKGIRGSGGAATGPITHLGPIQFALNRRHRNTDGAGGGGGRCRAQAPLGRGVCHANVLSWSRAILERFVQSRPDPLRIGSLRSARQLYQQEVCLMQRRRARQRGDEDLIRRVSSRRIPEQVTGDIRIDQRRP